MAGEITLDDVPEHFRQWARGLMLLPIYKRAVKILEQQTREKRAEALAVVPETIRAQVEAEAKRIFEYRRSLKNE